MPNSPGRKYLLVFAVGVSFTTLQVFQRFFVCQSNEIRQGTIRWRQQPLHVCRAPAFGPKSSSRRDQEVLYQCKGPSYDAFARRMHSFADNPVLHGDTWGRREFPLMDNTTVLMLGNSHTRQVGIEMACQYSHVLRSTWRNEPSELVVFEFENNSTLYLLTNTPFVYSYEWKSLIEAVLGKTLDQFDALALGLFNQYPGKITTNFDKGMIARTKKFSNVDYISIEPPTPWQILDRFHGPMVVLSMFSKWNENWIQLEKIAEYHGERVQAINARKYVPLLGECGSDNRLGTGQCYNDNIKREGMRLPNGMHRCTGAYGGHPDMIAWEVSEFMHTLKERSKAKPRTPKVSKATTTQTKTAIKSQTPKVDTTTQAVTPKVAPASATTIKPLASQKYATSKGTGVKSSKVGTTTPKAFKTQKATTLKSQAARKFADNGNPASKKQSYNNL